MDPQEYIKNRYLKKYYNNIRKKELENYTYPETGKFTIVYIVASVFIALSILHPVIKRNLRIDFFWDDSYFSYAELFLYLLPIFLAISVILIAIKLSPPVRSKIIFGFSAILIVLGVLIALVSMLFASGVRQLIGIIFSVLIVITPISYYSFNNLLTKFNNKRLKTLNSIFAMLILLGLFVPIIDDISLINVIFDDGDTVFFLIPILMLIATTLLTFYNYFTKNPRSIAMVNSYLLKGILVLIPIGIIIQEWNFDVRDYSYLFKGFSAIYGSFFLICNSFVEYIYVRLTVKITAFARPIIDRNSHIIKQDESRVILESEDDSDPYKSPIEIREEDKNGTEQ